MKLDNLEKLWVHELKDIYSAEKQLVEALPRFVESARDEELRQAFQDHLAETEGHVKRLDQIFETLDFSPGGEHCDGMAGLIDEGKAILESDIDGKVLDAALIAAAQRVEHYEIAAYGTARAFAEKLGRRDAVQLLQQTLEEEGKADRTLTRLAERSLNFQAMASS